MNIKFICTTLLIFISGIYTMTVEDRLLELERVVKLQSRTLENQEDVSQNQALMIERLKNENDQLKMRLEILENNIVEKKSESMTSFDTSVQRLSESLPNISSVSGQRDNISKTETGGNDHAVKYDFLSDVRVSRTKHSQMMKRESTNAAFHAYVSGTPCFQDHELMVFDVEELDVGNGYSTRDGIYVVPYTGYYVFTWTVGAYNKNWYRTDIVIDGNVSGWVTVQDEAPASGILVAHVSAGGHVFIRRNSGSYCWIHDEFTRSTFSGWKLF